jgi:hypothetical protein
VIDPSWLHRSATLHWPAPTLKNYIAILLLLIVASASSHPHKDWQRKRSRDKTVPA